MPNTPDVEATVERGKREILADIAAGIVPLSVKNFSQLHDYVDANGYGGVFKEDAPDPCDFCDFWNDVQNRLNQWLEAGGHQTDAHQGMKPETMQAVVAELQRRGIDASFEHPGYIHVQISETNYHAYGDANGETFEGNNMEDSECIETFESSIPVNSTDVQTIEDFIACNTPKEQK